MTPRVPSSSPVWTATDLAAGPHAAPDKADRVRKMFGGIAASYDLNNRLHSFGRDQAWRRAAVRLAAVRPADHVLDVACGTGDLTEAFAAAGPAEVIGVDFTEPMLDIARRKASGRRRAPGGSVPYYRTADALDLPFPDRRFDVVSIAFGIRNVQDPAAALREFHRVLRPGGRVVVLEFAQPENRVLRALSNLYCQRIMPFTAALVARDRSGAYRYLPESVATFADRAAFTAMLGQAGFGAVRTKALTMGVCAVYVGEKGCGSP